MAKNGMYNDFGGSSYGTSPVRGEWYAPDDYPIVPPVFMEYVRNDVIADVFPDLVENLVYSIEDITAAINESPDDVVDIKYGADIIVPDRTDGKITTIFIPVGKKVVVNLNNHSHDCAAYAYYVNGGELVVKGKGTIKTRMLGVAYSAIANYGGKVTLQDNVVIDTRVADKPEDQDNWMYGVTCFKGGTATIKDNVIIHTDAASAISTNGSATTGAGNFYISDNVALIADLCSAVYMASMDVVHVTGNAIISGGMILRMGHVTLQDNAKVVNNGFGDKADDFGKYIPTSNGPCALNEAAIFNAAGTYKPNTPDLGNDLVLTIKDNATVTCATGDGVVIGDVGTGYDQKVRVVSDKNVDWRVYSHDELADICTASGATLKPKTVNTDIQITVEGEVVFPVVDDPDGDQPVG